METLNRNCINGDSLSQQILVLKTSLTEALDRMDFTPMILYANVIMHIHYDWNTNVYE